MVKAFSKQIIHEIRRLVLSGVSKYETANILSISSSSVYKHTRDLPSKKTGNQGIRGKTLDVLKQLITKGYVFSTKDTSDNLHTIKKHFPNIKRTQINGKSMYYFNDKNKQALEAMLKANQSKIINYSNLSKLSTVFNVQLKKTEKQRFLGKHHQQSNPKMKPCKKKNQTSSKEKESSENSFLGRFLHSGVLCNSSSESKIIATKNGISK